VGQLLAAIFEGVGASITAYPGGVSALAKAASPPWWAITTGLACLWAGFGAAVALAYGPGRLVAWPGQWRARFADLAYVPLGVGCQFAVDLAYAIFHPRGLSGPENKLFGASLGTSFYFLGFLAVFVAPVFEEWLFRGVLYRALFAGARARFSRPVSVGLAAVVSAVLFGLAHAEWLQLAGLVALGVVLAVLAERTRRLVPSWVAHASFNATAFVALAIQRSH
jgi:membrane protease YdiL (CAAX protease family)